MDPLTLVAVVLLLLWLVGGWVIPIGGSAIHLLLVIVLVLVIVRLLRGAQSL